jgi:hypothetical protein
MDHRKSQFFNDSTNGWVDFGDQADPILSTIIIAAAMTTAFITVAVVAAAVTTTLMTVAIVAAVSATDGYPEFE